MLKNVFVVLRGSLAAQAISFVTLPLLARLYAPEDIGRYQVFLTVLTFLLLSASLRYDVAILNADKDETAFELARLCFRLNGVVAALTLSACGIVYLFWPALAARLGVGVWLLAPALFSAGVLQSLTYLLLREHAFKESSTARGLQALGNSLVSAGLGALRLPSAGLFFADVAGRMAAAIFVLGKMVCKDARYKLWNRLGGSLRRLACEYRQYPLISLPGSLLDGIGSAAAPVLMFGVFGPAVSGQYSLVERSAMVPIAVIAQAVSQVYMAALSSAVRTNSGTSAALFRRIVVSQFALGVVPALAVALLGRVGFEWVFGPRWGMAGQFAQIMAPLMLVAFVATPVNMTLLLLGKQKLNFIWYASRAVAVVVLWSAITCFQLAPLVAIAIHVAVSVICYLVLLAMMFYQLRREGSCRSAY